LHWIARIAADVMAFNPGVIIQRRTFEDEIVTFGFRLDQVDVDSEP
jgi:hypothetical protein